jgi:hypothetical protein
LAILQLIGSSDSQTFHVISEPDEEESQKYKIWVLCRIGSFR